MAVYLLLAVAQVAGLTLIPFSPFGIWVQLASLGAFGWYTGFQFIGVVPLFVLAGLVVAVEVVRLAVKATRMDGAIRRRMGAAGLAGALAGAGAGIPLPLIGSMFGALMGAAFSTLVAAFTVRERTSATSELAAQVLAMTLTTAAGVAIALFTLLIVLR